MTDYLAFTQILDRNKKIEQHSTLALVVNLLDKEPAISNLHLFACCQQIILLFEHSWDHFLDGLYSGFS